MRVPIPDGFVPGGKLRCTLADGTVLEVEPPSNAVGGQTLEVKYLRPPPSSAAAAPPSVPTPRPLPPPGLAPPPTARETAQLALLESQRRQRAYREACESRLQRALQRAAHAKAFRAQPFDTQWDQLRAVQRAGGAVDGAPARPPWPEPRGRLHLRSAAQAPQVLSVWALVAAFGEKLGLSPFSADELAAALHRSGDPTRGNTSTLLTEVHVRLLRALLADAPALRERQRLPSASDGLLLQQLAPPSIVTVGNWQEVLRSTLVLLPEAEAEEGLTEALSSLRSTEYSALAPSHKLCLLSALCGAYSEAPSTAALLFERERKQLERIGELPRTWRHLHDASLAPVAPPQEDVDSASVYSERCHGWIVLNQHHTPQDAELGPNAPPRAASTTPRPSEAATATLLEAIAARSASALATAIADAEAPAGGHVGIFQTTPQLARRWWTIELRRAHELLQELNREKMRNLKMRALAERQVGAFCDHLVSLAGGQTREEPIGVDSSGRRYWFFAADATRLWVEMPPAAGEAASAVGWRYYSTQRELKCLLQHLAGSATLPTWEDAANDACVASWQALATTPATQMYLPAGVGGGYCPYARGDAELLRSLAIRLPIIAKVNLSLSTTPPPTPPLRASDIPPYLPA